MFWLNETMKYCKRTVREREGEKKEGTHALQLDTFKMNEEVVNQQFVSNDIEKQEEEEEVLYY